MKSKEELLARLHVLQQHARHCGGADQKDILELIGEVIEASVPDTVRGYE